MVIGILAHVDAGKTTLSEALLYKSNTIRNLGNVDKKNSYMDTDEVEKERGITIYSGQARLNLSNKEVYLLDTPGHVDFSMEMERAMSVMDYAILLIDGTKKVQSHTYTLWNLLEIYKIPTIIFVNKMDRDIADSGEIFKNIKNELSENIIDFENILSGNIESETEESLASFDELLMEEYFEKNSISKESITAAIKRRSLYPVLFGSALKLTGIDNIFKIIDEYFVEENINDKQKLKVFKISRDDKGKRLTHVKVVSGVVKVKDIIDESDEKISEIRIYSGEKYESVSSVKSGAVCELLGLKNSKVGNVYEDGKIIEVVTPVMDAFLCYKLIPVTKVNTLEFFSILNQLAEENPLLKPRMINGEIFINTMGDIYLEILKRILEDKYEIEVEFGKGNVVYKETIKGSAIGVGHFEPLRHYAEIQLLIKEGEKNSGIIVNSEIPPDELSINYQKNVISYLKDNECKGILTGSELTDVSITLVSGKAHLKHTMGGDFREATIRAYRQGLMMAENVLLEPYYSFEIKIPLDMLGKTLNNLEEIYGKVKSPVINENEAVIEGIAPVINFMEYRKNFMAYTKGLGKILTKFHGYLECHNADEVIENMGYQPDDENFPTGSIFCKNGAGYYVPYNEVYVKMHLPFYGSKKEDDFSDYVVVKKENNGISIGEDEIKKIISGVGGQNKNQKKNTETKRKHTISKEDVDVEIKNEPTKIYEKTEKKKKEKCLLVDGYNFIHARDDLKIYLDDLNAARWKLIDILDNYYGYTKEKIVLVFDAYNVDNREETINKINNVEVVYTKKGQTADSYIERFSTKYKNKYDIMVVTNDNLEGLIASGNNAKVVKVHEFSEILKSYS